MMLYTSVLNALRSHRIPAVGHMIGMKIISERSGCATVAGFVIQPSGEVWLSVRPASDPETLMYVDAEDAYIPKARAA